MKMLAKILFLLVVLSACSSDSDFEKGKKQLEMQGYMQVENTGYDWFCCSDSDDYSTGFIATDKNGNVVEGCICSGVLKGITIRFK